MAEHVEKISKVTAPVDSEQVATKEVKEVVAASPSGTTIAERIVWYVAGVLLVLLAFRFVLALLGANPNNGFANFIYSVSHPFVAPFFSLFGYNLQYGVSRFETYTLIAIAVYAIIAYGLARLVTISRPEAR